MTRVRYSHPVNVTAPGDGSTAVRTDSDAIRVLDITKFYSGVSGGVKTYLDAKIRDFASREITHTLVIPDAETATSQVGRTRIYRLQGPTIPFARDYRLIVSGRALEEILRRERPDVIEVGSPFLVPWLVRWAARERPVRIIGFYHADLIRTYAEPLTRGVRSLATPLATAAARVYSRAAYGRLDVTLTASESVASELRAIGLRQVRVIPFGVDLDEFTPSLRGPELREQLGVEPGVPVALYVGRLCEEKRLNVVLEAHRRLPLETRPHLVFVGDGPQRAALEREARRRPRFDLLPYQSSRRSLARLYASADLYLAPGPGETFGLSIAEALASGLPVVAVASGAAPDRLQGSPCGRLYRRDDAAACAAAIQSILPALGDELRAAARSHAEANFDWTRTFDLLCELYRELAWARRRCA